MRLRLRAGIGGGVSGANESATMRSMDTATKLQLRSGSTVAIVGIPDGVELELPEGVQTTEDPASADAVIVFAIDSAAD